MGLEKPNIILIVLDAVRFDHLSCYGYERNTTPNIDNLAEQGVLFENAFSADAWTPTSMASVFTGKYPSNNGVLSPNLCLSEDNTMITQILQSHGYETLGASIPVQTNRSRGYDKGWNKFWESYKDSFFKTFLPFLEYSLDNSVREGWKVFNKFSFRALKHNFLSFYTNKTVKKWIENLDKGKPFFLYIHYSEAHSPYYPLNRFKEKFEEEIGSNTDVGKLKNIADRGGYGYMAREIEVSENEFRVLKSWYDGEISYIDFRFKEIFDLINEVAKENSIIILTSDHGENFGEHHLAYHQYCLYDTLIHVPLIIYDPRFIKRGKKIHNIVSLVDIFPTILDMANIHSEKCNEIDGKSLASFEDKKYHNYIFAEYGRPSLNIFKEKYSNFDYTVYDRELKCVRSLKFKYIISSNGDEELYNLEEDPHERMNILYKYPEIAISLKRELTKKLKMFRETSNHYRQIDMEEKIRKRLRELGYF